jgi:hypothetical protein
VTSSPESVSDCSTVVVEVNIGILLSMQEHADDMAVAGIVSTREANGVLVTKGSKAIVGSGEA